MPAELQKATIFGKACEIQDINKRALYLDEMCGGDDLLRAEIEELLAIDGQEDLLLDFQSTGFGQTNAAFPMHEKPGDEINGFKLVREIGEGGMGVVYLAEQRNPVRRNVALKIIKPGLETRHVIGRFQAERQVLAMMDHPSIAKVFDCGATSTGRPYFVMEWVKGCSVTRYCDEHHLTLRDRLKLFVQVCQAIQHAHQKGIIHRDIKPSNILVAEYDHAPVTKVIDFGIAKALSQRLTEQTVFTEFGQLVGTIDYMSPEQAKLNQEDIDTRSDIYSLGVLLYELLTGATPFDKKRLSSAAWDERLRIIREEEPPNLSTRISEVETIEVVAANRRIEPKKLAAVLHGELDWIALKALAKDRSGRYESASEFAADVQRYLNDEPVQACPPSTAYKVKKFVRRNARVITTAALIGLALLVSVAAIGSSLGWIARDRQSRQLIADGQLESILNQTSSLMGEQRWHDAFVVAQRVEVVKKAGLPSDNLRREASRVLHDLTIVQKLENAYLQTNDWREGGFDNKRVESIYSNAFSELGISIGDVDAREAADLLHAHPEILVALIDGLSGWAVTCIHVDRDRWRKIMDIANAVDSHPWRTQVRNVWLDRQFDQLEQLIDAAPMETMSASDVVILLNVLRAENQNELVAEFLKTAGVRFRNDTRVLHELAVTALDPVQSELFNRAAIATRPDNPALLVNLGRALYQQSRFDEAINCARLALSFDSQNVIAHNNLAVALSAIGQHDAAIQSYRNAVELDPGWTSGHRSLGRKLSDLGRLEEAVTSYRKAIELDPSDDIAHNSLGIVFKRMGRYEEALDCFGEAVKIRPEDAKAHYNCGVVCDLLGKAEQSLVHKHTALQLSPNSAPILNGIGATLRQLGRLDESLESIQNAIEIDDRLVSAYANQALVLMDLKKYDEAIESARAAIALQPGTARLHTVLGDCFRASNKLDQSIESYQQAIRIDERVPHGYFNLGTMLMNQGRSEEAVVAFSRAIELGSSKASAHLNLGFVLKDLGQLDRAIEQYRMSLELQPDSAFAHTNLGAALDAKGENELAITHHRRAIEIQPDLANAHHNLALVLTETKKTSEAVAVNRQALLLNPKHLEAWINQGNLLLAQDQPEEAADCFRKAMELEPLQKSNSNRVSQLNRLSIYFYRAGFWQESLDARIKKNKLEKVSLEDRLFLSMIHWQLGNKANARRWLAEASTQFGQPIDKTSEDQIAKLFNEAKELVQQED